MIIKRARVGVVAVLAGVVSACASTPAPMAKLLVPSVERVGELQKLSEQTATVAHLMTVTGQEKWLFLEHSDKAAFVGHAFDGLTAVKGMSNGPIEDVAFNEIALVYYATPPHPFQSEVAPEQAAFPSLPAPGAEEQRASCADLDVELARAEAIRWYARNEGAVPFTAGEAAGKHAKNFAKDTGIGFLVFFALAAGGGSGVPCFSTCASNGPLVLSAEDWRWVVTAAQRRVVSLLEFKQAKHCAVRIVAETEGGNLGVLEGTHGVPPAGAAGPLDDKARLAQQTAWLDRLNPMSLNPARQPGYVVDYGEGAVQTLGNAQWLPRADITGHLGSPGVLNGTIMLTEKSLMLQGKSDNVSSLEPRARIVFADMASVEIKSKLRARWVVVTQTNGRVDSFWLIHHITGDREGTEAMAALLKTKILVKSAAPAGK